MANETSKEIKNNGMMTEVEAFKADVKMEDYAHRVETGALTPEEKEGRDAVLEFLGIK